MFFADEKEITKEDEHLMESITEEAIQIGLLTDGGEVPLSENYNSELKRVKVTKLQKIKRLTQRSAMLIARKNDDPDYVQWRKHRDLATKYRLKIEKKLKNEALAKAKQVISGKKPKSKTSDIPKSKRTT